MCNACSDDESALPACRSHGARGTASRTPTHEAQQQRARVGTCMHAQKTAARSLLQLFAVVFVTYVWCRPAVDAYLPNRFAWSLITDQSRHTGALHAGHFLL